MVNRLNKRTKGRGVGQQTLSGLTRSPETLKHSDKLFKNKLAAESLQDVYDHLIQDANQRQAKMQERRKVESFRIKEISQDTGKAPNFKSDLILG